MPDVAQIEPTTLFLRMGVALAIGLLIGAERGWKDRDRPEGQRTAGLRTYGLLGLLGGIVGLLSTGQGGFVLGLAFIAVAGVMAGFEFLRSRTEGEVDATPLVAEMLVFALGAAAAFGYIEIAGAAAVAAAIVLAFKQSLHRWLERISFAELSSGLVLAAMTVVVLPLLPAKSIDPWNAISPRDVWLFTLVIASVSFAGYAAMRIIGPERGPLVAGLAGGAVSSTAAILSFSRLARDQPNPRPLAAGAVAANSIMFLRLGAIAAILRPEIAIPIAAAAVPALLAGAGSVLFLIRRDRGTATALELENPLRLRSALIFGALLAAVSLASAFLNETFGAGGTLALAATAGLADADAITLSMTQSHNTAAETAVLAILLAAAVNTVVKVVLAYVAGGRAMGRVLAVTSAASLVAAAAGYAVYFFAFASAGR